MERWRFELLGTPRAVRDGAIVTRFRSRLAWAVLAALLLEKGPHRREELARRFWPDAHSPAGRKCLREVLLSLRKTLGAETLDEDRESVAWIAPFASDVTELDAGNPAEVRGLFLDGIDDPGGFGWVERRRIELRQKSIEALRRQAQRQWDAGEREAAGQTALQLLSLDPDDEVGKAISLETLAPGARHRLAETLAWEEAAERTGEAAALSTPEARVLDALLGQRLATLAGQDRRQALSLAVFRAPFTMEQAQAICHATPADLERLARRSLLVPDERGFAMRPALRERLWGRLTGEERRRLLRRLRQHFWARFLEAERCPDDTGRLARFRQDAAHLQQAIDSWIAEPPTRAGVDFIQTTRHFWVDGGYLEGAATLERAVPYLTAAVESLEENGASLAAMALAHLAMDRRDFAQAVVWYRIVYERFGWAGEALCVGLLDAAHHGADDDTFDWFAPIALALPTAGLSADIPFLLAENRRARRRFDEALAHNDRAFALHQGDPRPVFWHQRASILAGMGRDDEAQQAWDTAIQGFEAMGHRDGVAECYLQLGALAAKRGQAGLGLSLAQHAIANFAQRGDPNAVAAAKGMLGEIYARQGQIETARALYQEGLAFWETKGHPRWIQHFRNRLERLAEPTSGK